MQTKQFLTPADIALELSVSTSTVLRLIHAREIPAIAVSERIYRIPVASFELYKAGRLRRAQPAPMGRPRPRPRIGEGESRPIVVGVAPVRRA